MGQLYHKDFILNTWGLNEITIVKTNKLRKKPQNYLELILDESVYAYEIILKDIKTITTGLVILPAKLWQKHLRVKLMQETEEVNCFWLTNEKLDIVLNYFREDKEIWDRR